MVRVQIEAGWPVPDFFEAVLVEAPWNGWATPAFTLEEFRKVAKAFQGQEVESAKGPLFTFNAIDSDSYEECGAGPDGLYRTDGWVWQRA